MANPSLPEGSDGTIPVDDAKQQTANWKAYLESSNLVTRAFLFPIETFNNLISSNPGADGIRVYLALKTAGDPKSLTALLVPTIDGNDVIVLPKADGTGVGGDEDDSNVYNFGTPCPPSCSSGGGL